MLNQDLKKKLVLYAKNPQLADFLERQKFTQTIKGEKGEKGDKPIKGVDYSTPQEILGIIRIVTPQKGIHLFRWKGWKKG